MAVKALHLDVQAAQRAHVGEIVCGDMSHVRRTQHSTTVILCDGIRNGLNANLAAEMATARLVGLLDEGFSMRQAMQRIVETMEENRKLDGPFAALSALQLRRGGACQLLAYAIPAPIMIQEGRATVLPGRPIDGCSPLLESRIHLEPGESILLVSDGITESGLGPREPGGWGIEGVASFVDRCYEAGTKSLSAEILDEVMFRDADAESDDCSVIHARCRAARVVVMLTGPGALKTQDPATVQRFTSMPGEKLVCGGTTAAIVAREMKRELESIPAPPTSHNTPPGMRIEGIDLVTEGIITLNQACNLLEYEASPDEPETDAERLADVLRHADRIHLLIGGAQNPSNENQTARRLGIQPRPVALARLQRLLEAMGKLVMTETI